MPEVVLDGDSIRACLLEVADLLGPGSSHTVVLVGGSLLAWHGLRASTHDIDSISPLDEDFRQAVAVVGARHQLDPTWLNDRARPFAPQTLRIEDCDVLLEHPRLTVLGAPLAQIFLMKLDASRATDVQDLVTLWPRCGFASPEAAVSQYHEAYPLAVEDEFLTDFVASISAAAAG